MMRSLGLKGAAALLLLTFLGGILAAAGCSDSENPVTPQKLQDMRKKEAAERAGYRPGGLDKPKGP